PKDSPRKEAPPAPVVASDDGFPLPAGALHRFGSRQARHPDGILGAAVSPNGKYLATLGNTSVVVWDARTMVAKCTFADQSLESVFVGGGARAEFLPDSKHLLVSLLPEYKPATVQLPTTVDVARLFNVETGRQKFTIRGGSDNWSSAWLAADG